MISRNTLKGDILKIYKDERTKYYNLLGKIKCRIAITTDMWTSSNNKGFMAVTGHFIDDNWTLQNCILRFLYVPAPHTAEVLADTLVESLMDWNIDRKVSTITVDNCTTNDAMINHLLQKLPTKDMLLDGKVLHMRCCAHILNLIVKDGLDTIGSSIERIRDSVIYWTVSPSRVEKFEETARQVPVNCTKKLCLDCKTRWNSTYLMLETAIIYKDVFPRLNVREKNYKSLPTEEDWVNAIEICGKLKLFHQVTEMFSGTLYPTSNFYFQKICDIKVKLDEWVKSPNILIQDMALSMLRKYDKYWEVCHILMGVAVVLDPRYKMSLVEFFFRKIYHESARFKIDEVRQNCYDLLFDYQSRCCTLNESSSSIGSLENTMSSDVHSDVNVDDSLDEFEQFVVSKTSGATNLSATSELDMYLEESLLPRARDFDILNWWKTNGVKFPTLQKMARDILAIPVSTVASESAFSSSGKLINPHRNRLHHTTVEALMYSRRWLWNEANDTCSTSDGIQTCPSILDEEDDQDDRDSK
ncbi:UNVERIFIED_CONTAM: putative AC transposase [Sesamum radiatum]|uniref:AC transposase n=1 Tax=Sesamum radiatum TaxID=300843 RepID=A0AAW2LAY2_SESRA